MSWALEIPFAGKNKSMTENVNLLATFGKFVVSDNHCTALYYWMKYYANSTESVSIMHIDRHWDCLSDNDVKSSLNAWNYPSVQCYLADRSSNGRAARFRWDNYLVPFAELCVNQNRFGGITAFCPDDKSNQLSPSRFDNFHPHRMSEILENLIDCAESAWIVNIDLDYFFQDQERVFSQSWEDRNLSLLAQFMNSPNVGLVTVALSPECCDKKIDPPIVGWDKAIIMLEKLKVAVLQILSFLRKLFGFK